MFLIFTPWNGDNLKSLGPSEKHAAFLPAMRGVLRFPSFQKGLKTPISENKRSFWMSYVVWNDCVVWRCFEKWSMLENQILHLTMGIERLNLLSFFGKGSTPMMTCWCSEKPDEFFVFLSSNFRTGNLLPRQLRPRKSRKLWQQTGQFVVEAIFDFFMLMKHSNRYDNWFVLGALSDEDFSFKASSIQTPTKATWSIPNSNQKTRNYPRFWE